MKDRTHWFGCWKYHHECALARIEQLENALEKIEHIAKEVSVSIWDYNRVLSIIEDLKEKE